SRRRHTRFSRDWSSDVCSSDLGRRPPPGKSSGDRPPVQGPTPPGPAHRRGRGTSPYRGCFPPHFKIAEGEFPKTMSAPVTEKSKIGRASCRERGENAGVGGGWD